MITANEKMNKIDWKVNSLKEDYKTTEPFEAPNVNLINHYYRKSSTPESDHAKVSGTLGSNMLLMKNTLSECLKMDPKSDNFIESSCVALASVDRFLKFGSLHGMTDLVNDGVNIIDDSVSLYIKLLYAEEGVEFFTDTKNLDLLACFSGTVWGGGCAYIDYYHYVAKDDVIIYNMVKRLISEFPNIGNRIRNRTNEIFSKFYRTMLFCSREIDRKNLAPMIKTVDGYVDYTGSIVPNNDEVVYPVMTLHKAENLSKFITECRNVLLDAGLPLSDVDEIFETAFKKFNIRYTKKKNAVKYICRYLKSDSTRDTISAILHINIIKDDYDDFDEDDDD